MDGARRGATGSRHTHLASCALLGDEIKVRASGLLYEISYDKPSTPVLDAYKLAELPVRVCARLQHLGWLLVDGRCA
jgi:hypothetical protein